MKEKDSGRANQKSDRAGKRFINRGDMRRYGVNDRRKKCRSKMEIMVIDI